MLPLRSSLCHQIFAEPFLKRHRATRVMNFTWISFPFSVEHCHLFLFKMCHAILSSHSNLILGEIAVAELSVAVARNCSPQSTAAFVVVQSVRSPKKLLVDYWKKVGSPGEVQNWYLFRDSICPKKRSMNIWLHTRGFYCPGKYRQYSTSKAISHSQDAGKCNQTSICFCLIGMRFNLTSQSSNLSADWNKKVQIGFLSLN